MTNKSWRHLPGDVKKRDDLADIKESAPSGDPSGVELGDIASSSTELPDEALIGDNQSTSL
jgi:hypothetical protein